MHVLLLPDGKERVINSTSGSKVKYSTILLCSWVFQGRPHNLSISRAIAEILLSQAELRSGQSGRVDILHILMGNQSVMGEKARLRAGAPARPPPGRANGSIF